MRPLVVLPRYAHDVDEGSEAVVVPEVPQPARRIAGRAGDEAVEEVQMLADHELGAAADEGAGVDVHPRVGFLEVEIRVLGAVEPYGHHPGGVNDLLGNVGALESDDLLAALLSRLDRGSLPGAGSVLLP